MRKGIDVLPLVILTVACVILTVTHPGRVRAQAPQALAGQVRDPGGQPRAAATGTARLSGTVTLASTGQAAAAVRVMLNGQDFPGGKSVLTDAQGRFTFAALPAGRYTVSASKAGYVRTSYGQRHPRSPPTMIPLSDGQARSIALQLQRAAVITGMVLDDRGEPAVNIHVRAMRSMILGGERSFQQVGAASTDDRGIYRIHSLDPGNYIVCANARGMSSETMTDAQRLRMQIEGMRRSLDRGAGPGAAAQRQQMMTTIRQLEARLADETAPDVGYAPVCSPGTSHTSTLSVSAADERSGVDLQMQLTQVATVEGVLVMPGKTDGAVFDSVQLMLANTDEVLGTGDMHGGMADGNGRFSIMNVPPGNYRLLARTRTMMGPFGRRGGGAADEEPALWGALDLAVAGEDISNITLQMQPGVTVSGRIVFEGSRPPADLSVVQVGLSPFRMVRSAALLVMGARGGADESGRFTIPDVVPGEYRLFASAPGWAMSSAMLSGEDVLDQPFEVGAGRNISGIVFTLTDRVTELSGSVVDDKGQPAVEQTVVLFAEDPKYWQPNSRRIRPARVMPDGKYLFQHVPPGEYRLAAFVDAEPDSWMDPAFLEQIAPTAMRISLAPGEKKIHNFRVN